MIGRTYSSTITGLQRKVLLIVASPEGPQTRNVFPLVSVPPAVEEGGGKNRTQ